MATTTNYGWTTPDDTAYVKDGANAIRTLGSAIDSSFADFKGGTTGQALTKATNSDLDFVWATPGGTLTKLANVTFSNVSEQNFDNIFDNSIYSGYLIEIPEIYSADGTDRLCAKMRYGSSTDGLGAGAQGYVNGWDYSGTTKNASSPNTYSVPIFTQSGTSSYKSSGYFYLFQATSRPGFNVQGYSRNIAAHYVGGGNFENGNGRTYSGFQLFATASNITGNVIIYGIGK